MSVQVKDIITIGNNRGYLDGDVAWLNAEDVARGWGFVQQKNGVEYVRWETVNKYLKGFGYSQQVGKDDYIPENMVYRLGFKANNEIAAKYQALLADEVLPAIRLHGAYMTPETIEKVLYNPDFMIRLAKKLKEAQEKVKELTPKGEFYDAVANSDTLFSMADVAKTLDMGIGRNRLFALLRETGILQPDNMPYQRYVDRGYFKVVEGKYGVNNNVVVSKTTYVKQKGIDFIRRVLHGTDA